MMKTSTEPPAWVEHGILVYGPRKAGTTLFQNLLDGGDQVFVFPAELKLKSFVRKPARGQDIEKYFKRSRIPAVDSPNFLLDRYHEAWVTARAQCTLQGLADFIRHDVSAVFASCSNTPGNVKMWCTKDVGGPTEQIFALWRTMFPHGKALFISRDPLMVTRAVLNDRRRKGRRLSLLQIAYETYDPMRVVAAQSRLLADPDVFLITYEDLVADTEGVMAEVAEFLGVPTTPMFLAPTVFSQPVIVRTASRQTTTVFQPATSWIDGLTSRERWIVTIVRGIASLLPRFNANYAALRQRVRREKSA